MTLRLLINTSVPYNVLLIMLLSLFLISINKPLSFSLSTKKNNEWYDKECKQMKEKFDLSIDIFKETNSDDDLKSLCTIKILQITLQK